MAQDPDSWLSDYLFTPLSLKLRSLGLLGQCAAILITMTAIGLWHGFQLNFLVFGLIQGFIMIVSALTLERRNRFFERHPPLARIRKILAPLITFHIVALSFVFLRAPGVPAAAYVLKNYMLSLAWFWNNIHSLADVRDIAFNRGFGLGRAEFLTILCMVPLHGGNHGDGPYFSGQ